MSESFDAEGLIEDVMAMIEKAKSSKTEEFEIVGMQRVLDIILRRFRFAYHCDYMKARKRLLMIMNLKKRERRR